MKNSSVDSQKVIDQLVAYNSQLMLDKAMQEVLIRDQQARIQVLESMQPPSPTV